MHVRFGSARMLTKLFCRKACISSSKCAVGKTPKAVLVGLSPPVAVAVSPVPFVSSEAKPIALPAICVPTMVPVFGSHQRKSPPISRKPVRFNSATRTWSST